MPAQPEVLRGARSQRPRFRLPGDIHEADIAAQVPLPGGPSRRYRRRNAAAIAQPGSADRRRRRRRRAAAGGHCLAHTHGDLTGAGCAHRRAHISQGRDAPAHRLVQVSRRLQQGVVDPAGGARWRRRGVLFGQPRPGRRRGSAAPRNAGRDRHAGRCAASEAGAHRGAWRGGRALRPGTGRPSGHRARDRSPAKRRPGAPV